MCVAVNGVDLIVAAVLVVVDRVVNVVVRVAVALMTDVM